MKIILAIIIIMTASISFADDDIENAITCEGIGTIQGAIFIKKKETTFYFNQSRTNNFDYIEGDGTVPYVLGHFVKLGKKVYRHRPTGSYCENISDESIRCVGIGHGSGSKIEILIDTVSMSGSGTYFNPTGDRHIRFPNESNTYQYNDLSCTIHNL